MPLSAAAPRKAQHIRRYEAIGYLREDGLYDIERHLTDEKTYPFDNRWRGTVVPGEKLHDMHLRLTINDDMEIVAVEAATEASPFRSAAISPLLTNSWLACGLYPASAARHWSGSAASRAAHISVNCCACSAWLPFRPSGRPSMQNRKPRPKAAARHPLPY